MKLTTQFLSIILLATSISSQSANIPEECQRLGFCTGQDTPESCNDCQLKIAVKNTQYNKDKNFQPGNPSRLPETFNPAVPLTNGNGNGNGNSQPSASGNNENPNSPSPTSINGNDQNPSPTSNGENSESSSANGNQNNEATTTGGDANPSPTSDANSSSMSDASSRTSRSSSSASIATQGSSVTQYKLSKIVAGVVGIAIVCLI